MLADQFWVEIREFAGQRVPLPHAHNAAFVMNSANTGYSEAGTETS